MHSTSANRSWNPQRLSGFKDRTNFRYYAFLSTISTAFILWMFRSMFIKSIYCNPNNNSIAAPKALGGECFWYLRPASRFYWGLQLHLSSCFPALALAIIQFTPSIRQKYPMYHRWIGRLAMVLGLIASVSPFLFADIAMGGTWSTFSIVWTLGPLCVWGHYKAWTAIRSGDIHTHRRWMLRTWACLGSIITMRPFLVVSAMLLTAVRKWFPVYMEMSCEKLLSITILDKLSIATTSVSVFKEYSLDCMRPELLPANLTNLQEIVQASLESHPLAIPQLALDAVRPGASVFVPASIASRRIDQTVSAINSSFGINAWIAVTIHFVLVEIYLNRTKAEDDRLKRVSDLRRRKDTQRQGEKTATSDLEEDKKIL